MRPRVRNYYRVSFHNRNFLPPKFPGTSPYSQNKTPTPCLPPLFYQGFPGRYLEDLKRRWNTFGESSVPTPAGPVSNCRVTPEILPMKKGRLHPAPNPPPPTSRGSEYHHLKVRGDQGRQYEYYTDRRFSNREKRLCPCVVHHNVSSSCLFKRS